MLSNEHMQLGLSILRDAKTFAVVGVSQDSQKYGHEVFQALRDAGYKVFPVNPKYAAVDGEPCYASLPDLPERPDVVITAAPAALSAKIAETCAELHIPVFWMPPGTETEAALEACGQKHVTAVDDFCPVFALKLPREIWGELP